MLNITINVQSTVPPAVSQAPPTPPPAAHASPRKRPLSMKGLAAVITAVTALLGATVAAIVKLHLLR